MIRQQVLARHVVEDLPGRVASNEPQAQPGRHRRRDLRPVGHRSQVYEPHPIGPVRQLCLADCQRHPGLSRPSAGRQRHQPVDRQRTADPAEVLLSPDQATRRHRQIRRRRVDDP